MFRFTIRDLVWFTLVVALVLVIVRDRWTAQAVPLALDGYCPVTLVQMKQWQRGNSQCVTVFEGQRYLFASENERQLFLATPQKYSPACGGNDAVRLVDEERTSRGFRRYGITYASHIYLFDSEESLNRFEAAPTKYLRH